MGPGCSAKLKVHIENIERHSQVSNGEHTAMKFYFDEAQALPEEDVRVPHCHKKVSWVS